MEKRWNREKICVADPIFHREQAAKARWNGGGRRENEESEREMVREERVKKMMFWGEGETVQRKREC